MNSSNNKYNETYFCPIIERNTTIPVSRTETFYTANDNQSRVVIEILQGESRFVKNNLKLGQITVSVPRGKAGDESIDVTYTYDINSLLEVIVKVNSTGEKKRVVIQKQENKISEEEANARFEELSYLKIHPREEEKNKEVLFRGERMYEESIGEYRQVINSALIEFENILNKQDKIEIENAREKLNNLLNDIEFDQLY